MKNIFLCFSFILSISLPCFAQDTDTKLDEGENPSTLKTHYKKSQLPTSEAARKSYVGLSLTKGEYEFKEGSLRAGYGINSSWLINGILTSTKNTDGAPRGELRFGIDGKVHHLFSARFYAIGINEPNDISGRGFSPGLTYELSSLWDPLDLKTFLTVDADFIRYNQKTNNLRIKNRNIGNSYNERKFEIGISQDLTEKLLLNFSFTKYTYGKEVKTLLNALGTRSYMNTNNSSVIDGYPSSTVTLGLDYSLTESIDTGFTLFSSKQLAQAGATRGLELNTKYRLNDNWNFDASFSTSRHSVTKIRFATGSLGITYLF